MHQIILGILKFVMKMTAFRVLQVQGPKFHAGSLELHIEYTALFALSAIYEGESGKCLYERGKSTFPNSDLVSHQTQW